MAKDRNKLRPKVGDRVAVRIGNAEMEGTVVEDRGEIGVGGRRLLRVEISTDPSSSGLLELPADQITVLPPERASGQKLSKLARDILSVAASAGGEVRVLEVDQFPGRWVRTGRGPRREDFMDKDDPRVAPGGVRALEELLRAGLVVHEAGNLFVVTDLGYDEASYPRSLELTWHLCLGPEGGHWCSLLNDQVDPQDLSGIFIIWFGRGGPTSENTVTIGRGKVRQQLSSERKNPEVLAFADHDLFTTWSYVYGPQQPGVEKYLVEVLHPRIPKSVAAAQPIRVNLP